MKRGEVRNGKTEGFILIFYSSDQARPRDRESLRKHATYSLVFVP